MKTFNVRHTSFQGFSIAIVLFLLLAGCLGSRRTTDDSPPNDLSARDAEETAFNRARAWQADAALLLATASELGPGHSLTPEFDQFQTYGSPNDFPSQWLNVTWPYPGDPHPGDGRSRTWAFTYGSSTTGNILHVGVFANGTIVTHEEPPTFGNLARTPAIDHAAWALDSTDLLDVAREVEVVRRALEAADLELSWLLYAPPEPSREATKPGSYAAIPAWILKLESASLKLYTHLAWNASNGQPLDFAPLLSSVTSDDVRSSLSWLRMQDAQQNASARPWFFSWWDYGDAAQVLGGHPVVARWLHQEFTFTSKFHVAPNESAAIQLLVGHQINRTLARNPQAVDAVKEALQRAGVPANRTAEWGTRLQRYELVPGLAMETGVEALREIENLSQERIRYFAYDIRMLPFDFADTPFIESGSIFYAPITRAGEDPAAFARQVVVLNRTAWETREVDAREWDVNGTRLESEGWRERARRLDFQERFFNSTFYRSFYGTPPLGSPTPPNCTRPYSDLTDAFGEAAGANFIQQPRSPGYCLRHFRTVYSGEGREILRYYPGARLNGRVTQDGLPVSGAVVIAYDAGDQTLQVRAGSSSPPASVPHDSSTTGADGRFQLRLPFHISDKTIVRVYEQGTLLDERSFEVPLEQAESGASLDPSLGEFAV